MYERFELNHKLFNAPRPIETLVRTDEISPIKASWKTVLATLAVVADMQAKRAQLPRQTQTEQVMVSGEGTVLRQPQFSHVAVHTAVTCPNQECTKVLLEEDIRNGWRADANNYTTECPWCACRFVPRFVVHIGGSGPGRTITCEFLSPMTLKKEVENVLGKNVALDTRLHAAHPTIFWNLIVHFDALRLDVSMILPQIDWSVDALPAVDDSYRFSAPHDLSTPMTPTKSLPEPATAPPIHEPGQWPDSDNIHHASSDVHSHDKHADSISPALENVAPEDVTVAIDDHNPSTVTSDSETF